jgi:hypothetical protein
LKAALKSVPPPLRLGKSKSNVSILLFTVRLLALVSKVIIVILSSGPFYFLLAINYFTVEHKLFQSFDIEPLSSRTRIK